MSIGTHQWNFLKARQEQWREYQAAASRASEAEQEMKQWPAEVPTASNEVLLKLVLDLNERLERQENQVVYPMGVRS